jgi:signal transduction histidine kinase
MWATPTDWGSGNWSPSKPIRFNDFVATVHPLDRESVHKAVQDAVDGDGEYQVEYRIATPGSAERWISGRGRMEFDDSRRPQRLLAVSMDVSERRRAEDAVRELGARLFAAQEEERARLARALHDDVTQRLAFLAIEAGREERKASHGGIAQVLRSMREHLVRLSEDVHALAYALHPAVLEDLGLVEALKAECDRFSAIGEIPVRLNVEPPTIDEPSKAVALCLFRITQEALRNVSRHARALRVEVTLTCIVGGLRLVVEDDGIGFDTVRAQGRPSLGVGSMKQRAYLIGARFAIDSVVGSGTTVTVWTPSNGPTDSKDSLRAYSESRI